VRALSFHEAAPRDAPEDRLVAGPRDDGRTILGIGFLLMVSLLASALPAPAQRRFGAEFTWVHARRRGPRRDRADVMPKRVSAPPRGGR